MAIDRTVCSELVKLDGIQVPLEASIIEGLSALLFWALAIHVSLKYNFVKIFSRRIYTQSISNTLWIIFFSIVGLRSALWLTTYVLDANGHGFKPVAITGTVFHGLSTLFLGLALNHQRVFRSAGYRPIDEPLDTSETRFVRLGIQWTPVEFGLIVLFLLEAAFAILRELFWKDYHWTWAVILFSAMYINQRIAVITLYASIVFPRTTSLGPSLRAKLLLAFGILLFVATEFNGLFWSNVLPTPDPAHCILGHFQYTDIFSVIHIIAGVLLFIFVKREYLRNREECIWNAVSQAQV